MNVKAIAAAILCAASVPVFAGFQYEINTVPYDNAINEGMAGNYYSVTVTEGAGSFYIVDKISNLYDMAGNTEVLANVMSDYGYVAADGTLVKGSGEKMIVNQAQQNTWNDVITQYGYKLGDFIAGDTFGVWVANTNGTVSTSTETPNHYNGSYGLDGVDKFGLTLAELDYTDSDAIFFSITGFGGSGAPSGQPLPGVLATLLVGGSVFGISRFRKKRD